MHFGYREEKKYKELARRLQEDASYRLKGSDGVCFIKNDEIIKIYNSAQNQLNFCDLSKYQSDRIAFPKYYLRNKEWIYGEVMQYFQYSTISDGLDLRSDINRLIENYYVIMHEIERFPDLYMSDLDYSKNILYSEKDGFYLIDTTIWNDEEWHHIEKRNMHMLNKAIKAVLFDAIGIDVEKEKYDLSTQYSKIRQDAIGAIYLSVLEDSLGNDFDFLMFINSLTEIVHKYFYEDIKTVDDVKKFAKKIKIY